MDYKREEERLMKWGRFGLKGKKHGSGKDWGIGKEGGVGFVIIMEPIDVALLST